MNPLRLEQISIFDVEPTEAVTIAEGLGVPMISLWTTGGIEGARPVTAASKGAVLERLRSSPVVVDTAEAFLLGADVREAEASIALAAELGARAIVAVNLSVEADRAAGLLAELCALAQRYELLVSLEPVYMGVTHSPADGLSLVKEAGAPNAGLTVDLLHVYRSGTSLSELARLDPGVISSVQICDGPPSVAADAAIEEGMHSRMVPGTGSFDAAGFLRAIPPAVALGMEVPMRALRERGVSARERTRMVVEATRALQEEDAPERRE